MINQEILNLQYALWLHMGNIQSDDPERLCHVKHFKVQYVLSRNIERVDKLVKGIRENIQNIKPDVLKEAEKELQPEFEKAQKNNKELSFEKFIESHDFKQKTAFEKAKADFDKQVEDFLKEESDFEPYRIDLETLPDDLPISQVGYNLLKVFAMEEKVV